jgi:aminopeptidase N
MSRLRGFVVATAVVAAVGILPAPALAGRDASAGADSYFPSAGSMAYDVANYSLQIRYNPAGRSFAGVATISATASQAMSAVDLDLRGFTVRSAKLNGRPAGFRRSDRKVTVSPPAGLAAGAKFTVEVRYDGTTGWPTDPTGVLYGWISTRDGAFVANEPDGAATWYPVNDRPTDKATYDLEITVPAGKTAVGNGDLVGSQTTKGWTTWRWRATDPMSSYLATVSIGDYDLRRSTGPGGLPILTAVDRKLPRGADAALARTNQMISYFSQLLGPYPFSSYGAIVDDSTDAGYSLETQTRPIYAGPPTEDDVAHETAHQWIGDSVGPQQWDDIWLAEGITTYLQWLWQNHTGGDSPEQIFADAYAVPAKDAFWTILPGDPGVDDMFAESVYTRGAMTLQALRAKIGDPAFFTLLRRWCDTYRGSTASTSDFISLAEKVSNQELDAFFQTWLYKPTKPAASAVVARAAGMPATAKGNKHRPRNG